MELSELIHDNWLNLVIFLVLSFVAIIYKKRGKNNYFDNIIKYAVILEKTPQPKYQIDYLNNIKKKLIWEKVCFYKAGNIDKESIAISLVNADVHNLIELTQLDLLTQYFKITEKRITPLKPYFIKEVMVSCVEFMLASIMLLSNIITVFSSPWIINVIVAILTNVIIIIALFSFTLQPIKRLKIYLSILKDNAFLQRANNELAKIIKDKNRVSTDILEEITESEK
ncbi:hypothetical protein [Gilliamella sp. App4-10]|uniref:hypothetical protein n=1 Tax=Gilliamella sp. App4-10 TaxID=3120231 RepID=UPI00080E67DC|nr:hypothetical protein [Gilliamella apicola]OCG21754.1 hypothetical protein A9G23_04025 [Gilliamella apicola]